MRALTEKGRIYGGWFLFAGELIKPGERLSDVASTKFQYWSVEAIRLPKPEADFESKVLAVEFYTTLPWVIAEQPILFQALASFAALQR